MVSSNAFIKALLIDVKERGPSVKAQEAWAKLRESRSSGACLMQCVSFFAALALVPGAGKTMACENAGCAIGDELAPTECNSIGCVRPTNGFDNLAKIAERSLSVMRVPDSANALRLCNAGTCATEPALTRLPERCGRAGCIMPEPKAPRPAVSNADVSASTPASTLVTDVFA